MSRPCASVRAGSLRLASIPVPHSTRAATTRPPPFCSDPFLLVDDATPHLRATMARMAAFAAPVPLAGARGLRTGSVSGLSIAPLGPVESSSDDPLAVAVASPVGVCYWIVLACVGEPACVPRGRSATADAGSCGGSQTCLSGLLLLPRP